MKFKTDNKCVITSEFSNNDSYRPIVHTGVDWACGYGSMVTTDNAGYVYKVFDKDNEGSDGWRAVYILVPYEDYFMEVCLGHMEYILVDEGQEVLEDAQVGTEGNFGLVYSNGVQITPEMRMSGDRRGSHVHEQYRPVKKVKRTKTGKHYLRTKTGRKYKDEGGNYYEIVFTNDTKGCIDPFQFEVAEDPLIRIEEALKRAYDNAVEDPTEEKVGVVKKLWTTLLNYLRK